MKGNSDDQIQTLADSQATRTKVAHAVMYANKVESDDNAFVSNNRPEWQALGRQLCLMFLNWQTQTIIVISNLVFYISTKHVCPCRIIANN